MTTQNFLSTYQLQYHTFLFIHLQRENGILQLNSKESKRERDRESKIDLYIIALTLHSKLTRHTRRGYRL